VVMTWSGD